MSCRIQVDIAVGYLGTERSVSTASVAGPRTTTVNPDVSPAITDVIGTVL